MTYLTLTVCAGSTFEIKSEGINNRSIIIAIAAKSATTISPKSR